jgi:hypothetical protein
VIRYRKSLLFIQTRANAQLTIATTRSLNFDSGGDKGFTASMASYNRVPWGPIMSNWEAERAERNRRSIARLTKSLPGVFPSAVLSRALGRPFVPPTPRGSPSTRIGAPIHFALTGLRVPSLRGAEYLPAGGGGSEVAARMGCRPHSERHRPLIGIARIREGPWILLCLRATSLSLRLACRPLERRSQQECDLALRLCSCMAILDYAK